MKLNTRILLKINENPGVSMALLISWLSRYYKNKSSAGSALSRSIRMMKALELIREEKRDYFITDKGLKELDGLMKPRLIMNLNELVLKEQPTREIGRIVSGLATMNEKIKHDDSLKETAIENSKFFLSDLRRIAEQLEKQVSHLEYLKKIFERQISELEKLGFKDVVVMSVNKKNLEKLLGLCKGEALIVSSDQILLKELQKESGEKAKQSQIIVPKMNRPRISGLIARHSRKKTEIFFGKTKAVIVGKSMIVQSPFEKMKRLEK